MNKLLIRNKHISLLQGARVFIVQSRQLVPHYEGVATGTCRKHSSTNGTRFLWSHFNLIPSHQDTAEKSPRWTEAGGIYPRGVFLQKKY